MNLSASSIRNYRQCQTLYFLSNILRIAPLVEPEYFRTGTAWHELHETFGDMTNLDTDKLVEKLDDMYSDLPDYFDEAKANYEKKTMLVTYLAWRNYWDVHGDTYKVLESEIPFEIEIPGALVRGKIDALIEDEKGIRYVREYKSTTEKIDIQLKDGMSLEPKFWGQFKMAIQPLLYNWAAKQFGWDIAGVQYDVWRKPTIRPSDIALLDDDGLKIVLDADGNRALTKAGKPRQTADKAAGHIAQKRPMEPEEWADKLTTDILKQPERYFGRKIIYHTHQDFKRLNRSLNNIIKQIEFIDKHDAWDQNTDQCLQYGSCRFCGICFPGLDMTKDELPEGFKQKI